MAFPSGDALGAPLRFPDNPINLQTSLGVRVCSWSLLGQRCLKPLRWALPMEANMRHAAASAPRSSAQQQTSVRVRQAPPLRRLPHTAATHLAQQHQPQPRQQQPREEQQSVELCRRFLLASGAAFGAVLLSPRAHAARLRSLASSSPSTITFINAVEDAVKLYWLNYDGDAEFYALVPPGGSATIDTFDSHPFRVVASSSGSTLHEVVAAAGQHHRVVIEPPLAPAGGGAGGGASSGGWAAAEKAEEFAGFDGFDGVGTSEASFLRAQVQDIAIDHLGGVAILAVDGIALPTAIPVATTDAAALFHASGVEFRRPSTIACWASTLRATGATLERALLTRQVGSVTYGRLVVRGADGQRRSVDARPADCLALALSTGAPLFIHRQLAAPGQGAGAARQPLAELQGPSARLSAPVDAPTA